MKLATPHKSKIEPDTFIIARHHCRRSISLATLNPKLVSIGLSLLSRVGITAVLGGVIASVGIKKRQENLGTVARALIVVIGSIVIIIGVGPGLFLILVGLAY